MITVIVLTIIALVVLEAIDKHGDLKSWADSVEE
jgi:hypothetical protein